MRTDRNASAPSRVPAEVPTLHSRRDRLFTIVFIVVLVVMGSLAFRPRASVTLDAENRTMAPWPTGVPARTFPTAFEHAFADRFGGREALLRGYNPYEFACSAFPPRRTC